MAEIVSNLFSQSNHSMSIYKRESKVCVCVCVSGYLLTGAGVEFTDL